MARCADAEWLAVVLCGFAGVSPSAQRLYIPLLLHLTRSGGDWKVTERLVQDSNGHKSFQGTDLPGDGRDKPVVESDSGQNEVLSSELYIFDLTQGRFDARLDMASRISASVMGQEQYLQVLDVPRSLNLNPAVGFAQ